MAFLGILIEPNAAKQLSEITTPGEKTPIKELHSTLFYFGKDWPISQVQKSLAVISDITQGTKSFTAKTNHISCFERCCGELSAVIAKLEGHELFDFRSKLAERFEQEDIKYAKDFVEFRPHITLSYSKEIPNDFNLGLPISFSVKAITLFAGDEMDDRIVITFPLQSVS
jgi:2'-5' RNA ligase